MWFKLGLFIFILTALAYGSGLYELGLSEPEINSAIDLSYGAINNISFNESINKFESQGDVYTKGILKIAESGVQFTGATLIESLRLGAIFGYRNPQFFTPEFVYNILKLLLVVIIISFLIKPLFYLGIIIVMLISKFWDWRKKKKDG